MNRMNGMWNHGSTSPCQGRKHARQKGAGGRVGFRGTGARRLSRRRPGILRASPTTTKAAPPPVALLLRSQVIEMWNQVEGQVPRPSWPHTTGSGREGGVTLGRVCARQFEWTYFSAAAASSFSLVDDAPLFSTEHRADPLALSGSRSRFEPLTTRSMGRG